jgi:hypothetical protein
MGILYLLDISLGFSAGFDSSTDTKLGHYDHVIIFKKCIGKNLGARLIARPRVRVHLAIVNYLQLTIVEFLKVRVYMEVCCSYYHFSRHYQIAVKIKSLYLTHYAYYLTSNTTRVVQ